MRHEVSIQSRMMPDGSWTPMQAHRLLKRADGKTAQHVYYLSLEAAEDRKIQALSLSSARAFLNQWIDEVKR